ncbi:polysialyltransferase family glycosyltransferase [Streptomyces sp. ML-6]|uniref:polysialyltransferase family glycosyltransferase n=1 Tax=Streptomyces sp. ML-6 TaxID=2982693 RepID=UPI0024BF7516|nr:polysialyltransferase family glycosyltransferase [Streptomyces sp. ML-6]MDK0521690.1 alpha-2,8-polysialyltransferase family protein [Streptomyces sp. ML-6]
MTTQILCASTLYGAATLAAAVDTGLIRPADRRVLLISNNAAVPEVAPPLDAMPGFEAIRDRFDEVLSWNAAIEPFHPSGWSPRAEDVPLWERHLRRLWELGDDDVEFAVESIQVNPALAVTGIFTGAAVDVYADGLMSYGPTRIKLDPLLGTRVRRVLHLDLVPGLAPLLLTEFGVGAETIPDDAFRAVLEQIGARTPAPEVPYDSPALLLGQYLSALDILTVEEEEELHLRMLRGTAARGHRQIVFKPHPTAPARWSRLLEAEAARLCVEFTVLDAPVLAETLYERLRPVLVVGCFSTALFTARQLYGLDTARTGTGMLLARLTPYQNSNRVPAVLAHTLLPELETGRTRTPGDTGRLVTAIGFTMQPRIHPGLRPAATAYLTDGVTPDEQRLFPRRRLTALGLPGGLPGRLAALSRNPAVRRAARKARRLGRAVLR